ncbi:zincin [Piromyces finnis]|uniref:mitochondrial intermediate peptidase n=1 Tax=Piromyces finnis TaxID=1754191 RepID=A0A1Y1V5H8_9FUNG|nr:zincin [Piromyces finnis]|eukprot:ORX47817.1 zincin [Piromyces finnis]
MHSNILYSLQCFNNINKFRILNSYYGLRYFSTSSKSKVNSPLKRIFNDTFYWNHHVQKFNKNNKNEHVGLCGFTNLNSPEELIQNAQLCVKYSNILVNTICNDYISNKNNNSFNNNYTKENPQILIVKRLDRLSDKLCSMIDTFELLRNVHPNPEYIDAANEAYEILNNYFGQLNTNYNLYESLKYAITNKDISVKFSEEEITVAQILMEDFENSGIHMSPENRREFIEIQDKIARLGHKFTLNAYTDFRPIEVENPRKVLKGLLYKLLNQIIYKVRDTSFIQDHINEGIIEDDDEDDDEDDERTKPIPMKEVAIISNPFIAQQILQTVEDEEIRKKVYMELNYSTDDQIKTLEEMLFLRGDLAHLIGYSSYSEMNIKNKMAKSQENVLKFLKNMSNQYKSIAEKEIQELLKEKKKHQNKLSNIFKKTEFYPWDYQYYTNVIKNSNYNKEELSNKKRLYRSLLSYFSIGSIIEGLSNLYSHLYGISFKPSTSISKSEFWHKDVRKLDVIHEVEGKIGTIYCDFFTRPNSSIERKYENAAHFTIQCARRVDFDQFDTKMNKNLHIIESINSSSTPEQIQQNSVMMKQIQQPFKYFEGQGTFQLPIVVIVTNFERPSEYYSFQQSSKKRNNNNRYPTSKPSLLTWPEMETLFHEMGHAIHSILARTNFQNISGTRCKMDFVEVPSILMEHFLQSDEVISSIARHYQTDEPLKSKYVDIMKNSQPQNYNSSKYINIQNQLKLSLLDQLYHSSIFNKHSNKLSDKLFNLNLNKKTNLSTKILEQVTKEFDIYPYIQDTQWQGQFTHLFSYGSTYYTYFWCRKIAEEIWNKLFNSNNSNKNNSTSEKGQSKSIWDSLKERKSFSIKENVQTQQDNSDPLRVLGEKLKNELLKWGGARDPWIGLKNLGIVNQDLENDTLFTHFINDTK